MRTTTITLAVLMLLGSWCPADIVYMKNGKKYEGKATKKDDKVIIELKIGTMEVLAEDVLAIDVRELPKDEPASKPADKEALPPSDKPTSIGAAAPPVNPELFVMPESHAFLAMRNLLSSPGMLEARARVERWQAMAHDRKRRTGEWVGPDEFTRRRATFNTILKDAETSFKKTTATINRPPQMTYSGTGASQQQAQARAAYEKALAEQRHAEVVGIEKIQQAAQAWADPLLRSYLMGLALYRGKAYEGAQDLFRKCCQASPRVAAFHQGFAMALPNTKRNLESLAEYMQVLSLCPDSQDAVEMARAALKAVPGADMKRDIYTEAQRRMRDYEDAKPSSASGFLRPNTVTLMLPGKPVPISKDSLPVLPYDRLVFRQAVGVPIGPHTLLVDRAPLEGELDVFVRIDEKTIVPAKFKQTSMTGIGGKSAPPLALLTVEECTFKPLETDETVTARKGGTGMTLWESLHGKAGATSAPAGGATSAPIGRKPIISGLNYGKTGSKKTPQPTTKEAGDVKPPESNPAPAVPAPVAAKKDEPPPAGLAKGDSVTFYGLSIFEEMGSTMRKVGTKVASAPTEEFKLNDALAAGEVGTPLIAGNKLVGFYLGKTDPTAENGGPDKFLTAADLAPFLRQAKGSMMSSSPGFAFAKSKRTITPKDVEGQAFLVYVTAGEVLK